MERQDDHVTSTTKKTQGSACKVSSKTMSTSPFSAAVDRKDWDDDGECNRFVPKSSVTRAAVGPSAMDGSLQGEGLAKGMSFVEDGPLILASRGNGSADKGRRPKLQFGSDVCQGQQNDDSPGATAVRAEPNNLLSTDDSGDFPAVASFASPMKVVGDDSYSLHTPDIDAAGGTSMEAGIAGLTIDLESHATSNRLESEMANLNIEDSGGAVGGTGAGISSANGNGSANTGNGISEGGQSNLLDVDSLMTQALLATYGDLSGDSASWTPTSSADIGFGTDFFSDDSPGIGSPGIGNETSPVFASPSSSNGTAAAAALTSSSNQQPRIDCKPTAGSPSSTEAISDLLLTAQGASGPSSTPFASTSKGGKCDHEGNRSSSPGNTGNKSAHGHYTSTGLASTEHSTMYGGWKTLRDNDSHSTDSSASEGRESRGDNRISLGTASLLTRDLASPVQEPSVGRVPYHSDANEFGIIDAGFGGIGGTDAADMLRPSSPQIEEDEDQFPEMPPLPPATTYGAASISNQIPPSLSSHYYHNSNGFDESTEAVAAAPAAAASTDFVISIDDENFIFDVRDGAYDGRSEGDALLDAAGGPTVYEQLQTNHFCPLSSIIPVNDLNKKMQAAVQRLEIFAVEEDDAEEYSSGNKGVTPEQVGIRCTYCTYSNLKGQAYFVLLSGTDQVYAQTYRFINHFSKHCNGVDDATKKILAGKATGKSIPKAEWTNCFDKLKIFAPVLIFGEGDTARTSRVVLKNLSLSVSPATFSDSPDAVTGAVSNKKLAHEVPPAEESSNCAGTAKAEGGGKATKAERSKEARKVEDDILQRVALKHVEAAVAGKPMPVLTSTENAAVARRSRKNQGQIDKRAEEKKKKKSTKKVATVRLRLRVRKGDS